MDPSGHKAGDFFDTPDLAALDFAMTYNDDSIRFGREYGSSIYIDYDESGNKKYSYTIPKRGEFDSVSPSTPKFTMEKEMDNNEKMKWQVKYEYEIYADIHTHGKYDEGYDNNNFSRPDKFRTACFFGRAYLVTPNGSLKYYSVTEPSKDLTYLFSLLGKNIPSDINDPTRVNEVDPKNFSVDPCIDE